MQHYPIGRIKETKNGYNISLFNGRVDDNFETIEEAIAFTNGSIESFIKSQKIQVAVEHLRSDGIKTYILYDLKHKPYEVSEFDYKRTHSSYFNPGVLRTVIDEQNISFKAMARVNSSGTPLYSKLSWMRIFISSAILIALSAILYTFVANSLNSESKYILIGLTAALDFIFLSALVLTLCVKYYYHSMIGKRKNRDLKTIHKIQNKNWGKFNRWVRTMKINNLAMMLVEIILTIALLVLFIESPYFDSIGTSWESNVLLALAILYLVNLMIVGSGVYLYSLLTQRHQRKAIINTYLSDKHKQQYMDYIKNKGVKNAHFQPTRRHYVLKDAPASIKKAWSTHQSLSTAKAVAFKAQKKREMKLAVREYFGTGKTYK